VPALPAPTLPFDADISQVSEQIAVKYREVTASRDEPQGADAAHNGPADSATQSTQIESNAAHIRLSVSKEFMNDVR
jgi:hypothetical protein